MNTVSKHPTFGRRAIVAGTLVVVILVGTILTLSVWRQKPTYAARARNEIALERNASQAQSTHTFKACDDIDHVMTQRNQNVDLDLEIVRFMFAHCMQQIFGFGAV